MTVGQLISYLMQKNPDLEVKVHDDWGYYNDIVPPQTVYQDEYGNEWWEEDLDPDLQTLTDFTEQFVLLREE